MGGGVFGRIKRVSLVRWFGGSVVQQVQREWFRVGFSWLQWAPKGSNDPHTGGWVDPRPDWEAEGALAKLGQRPRG